MSENTFAFRRYTDPLMLPVGQTAQRFDVPAGFIKPAYTSFLVVNPNSFWVRLKGFDTAAAYADIADGQGFLLAPGESAVYATQRPAVMSTIGVVRQGIPVGSGFLELSYGNGV